MRTIQIAEETYKFLQSKAIPFEEQPDDTIRRLLGMGTKTIDNQPITSNSNDSNTPGQLVVGAESSRATSQSNSQSLREFYSNILENGSSKLGQDSREGALNAFNSNKSLESGLSSNKILEDDSNSNAIHRSNSNIESANNSNSKEKKGTLLSSNSIMAQSLTLAAEKYSNISKSSNASKGKKKPKTNLPELVRDGMLKENERVYFQNYRGVKFPQYEVTIADGQLKWNNNRYSMSDLASKILKDLDPNQDNEFVRGPILWVNAGGKTIAELWDVYLAKKGI